MKKTFALQDLDCANCAAKMEQAVGKLPGVESVNISFMQQRMTLEAADGQFADVLAAAEKTMRKIEPDVRVLA